MSSVLIGIIGVALFMAIAIGSAVFLGPRFEDAQASAIATKALSSVSTLAQAGSAYRMATGTDSFDVSSVLLRQQLLDARVIRAMPDQAAPPGTGTASGDTRPVFVTAGGVAEDQFGAPGFRPRWVMMTLGDDRASCTAVERSLGRLSVNQEVSSSGITMASLVQRNAGCAIILNASSDSFNNDQYVVYARM